MAYNCVVQWQGYIVLIIINSGLLFMVLTLHIKDRQAYFSILVRIINLLGDY
jgi:hypothetical protein